MPTPACREQMWGFVKVETKKESESLLSLSTHNIWMLLLEQTIHRKQSAPCLMELL
jgi:hypothetical protein